jgi:hypothetical protein
MLQQRGILLSTARAVVDSLRTFYEELRTDKQWEKLWNATMKTVEGLDLDKPELPRIRKPPKRLELSNCASEPHIFQDARSQYKVEYFKLLDLLICQLERRFVPKEMNAMIAVERLLTGKKEDEDLNTVMATYSLIFKSRPSLVRHLENLSDLCGEERDLTAVIEQMKTASASNTSSVYKEVISLIKIYCSSPVTSVECERSFSVMRRLMSWLRRTTSQERLNHEFILLTHANRQNLIDMNKVIKDFVMLNISRQEDFGNQQ